MTCPSCKAENTNGGNICLSCGASFTLAMQDNQLENDWLERWAHEVGLRSRYGAECLTTIAAFAITCILSVIVAAVIHAGQSPMNPGAMDGMAVNQNSLNGSRTSQSELAVPAKVEIRDFRAQPLEVPSGQPINLTWDVANGNTIEILGLGAPRPVGRSGSMSVVPSADTRELVLRASGEGTSNFASVTVPIKVIDQVLTTDRNLSARRTGQSLRPRIKFNQFPALVDNCAVWILRWRVEGAPKVTVDNEVKQPTGYMVVSRQKPYELRVGNSDVVIPRKLSLDQVPGKNPCRTLGESDRE